MHNQLEGTKPTSVYIGGGSLIHSSFVLTMATKVIIFTATDLMARVGEFDFTDTSDTYKHEDINVKNIIIHEGFVHAKARPNNIALLQLEKPVKFDQNINTVCLPPRNAKFDNKLCTVSSWGKNKLHNANDVFPSILKKTEMKVHPKAKCDGDYNIIKSQINDLPLGIICAGGGEKENCLGHGGSPLVCPGEDGNYYQVGIAAWGLGCTKPNVPIAYTEVSHYVEWIFNKINNA